MFFGKKNKIRVIFFATVGVLLAGFVFGLNLVKAQTIKTTKGTLDISAYILNQENKEIPNGKYQVRFAIYSKDRSEKDPYPSDDDKNSRIWEEEQEVEISSGVFNTYLGLVSALPENIDLAASEYYLGIRIGEDSESIPRKKIGYVPSAINAINSVNSTFVNGATTGIAQGNILLLGKNGKIDLDRLPTGTDANSLVLGDDGRLHDQNTDTGTNSTEFNIGNGTGVNSNFNLTVSNASNKPAIRFNGLSQKWELSNDGTTFAELGGGSALQSQIDQRALIGHTHSTADIISGTLSASRGGTGLDGAFATDGQLLIGNGTGYSLGNLSSSDSSIVITNGSGAIDLVSSLGTNVDISSETNLTASGLLLNLTGDNLSINEGILTDGMLCTYSSTDGLICDTLSSSVGHAPVSIGSPANGLSVNGAQTISLALASATTNGALSSSDWNIFNNKVSSQWITTGSDIYYLAGNVGIGTSSIAERLTVAGNIQLSGSIFATNTSQDIGTATERFRYGYFENLDVNNISVGGLDISGSIANIFTINSNNATNDTEDSFLAFDRGENGGVSNLPATIQWDSANDIFVTNYPLSISGNATAAGFSVGGETITDWTGTGMIISGGALTTSLGTAIDISSETNLAVGGTLLTRADDTLSLREGFLANGRLCTYDTTSGLVCNTDSATVGHNALTINATANGLSVNASQVLSLALASTSTIGALSDTDWDTFNNKQNALTLGNITGTTNRVSVAGGTGAIIGTGVTLNLPQDIATTSTPTFGGLTVSGNQTITGSLGIRESTGATFYTYFQGGDQSGNITYTLPTGAPASDGYVLTSAANGTMSWQSVSGTGGTTGTGSANQVTYWTGTSTLAGENQLNVSRGGTGIDGSTVANGRLLIGNGTGYTLANLTSADSSIVITNGAGSINLVSSLGTAIDISSETNLTGDAEIVLTGDSLSIAASIARDSELHSAVTLSGQTYLSLVGQALTASQINLTSHVTGTLPVANGGTGATSLNDLITLGTHTAGNYISTVTGNTQIVVGGVGAENATATLSIGADSIGDTQLAFNTGQHLATTNSPTFAGLTLNGNQTLNGTLAIREGGGTPTNYTTFVGGVQSADVTYTLPTGAPSSNGYFLSAQTDGTLAWQSISGAGGMNSFSLSADTGTTQTIGDSETVNILGGTNLASTIDASNNVTLNLDSTLTGVTWNGNDIDISDYTNLSGNAEIVLTGDSLSIAASIARDSELHTIATVSGTPNYITLSGQDIVRSLINLTSHVTGTLPVANGGTGAITLNDLITLGTHTTGSYVNTITGNTQIVVGGVGAENATATLSIGADSIGDTQLEFNTGQNLTTTSSPTFAGLTLNGNQTVNGTLAIREGGGTPTNYTTFVGGVQSADVTYTLPVAGGNDGEVLKTDASGNLYWALVAGGTGGIGTVTSVSSGNGLTGGPITGSGTLSINLLSTDTDSATASSYSGMEFVGGQLSLIRGCGANEVMGWDNTNGVWKCTSVSGTGGTTGSGLAGHIPYWSSASNLTYDSNGDFFWDVANNRLGIGTTSPVTALDVNGTITTTGLTLNGNQTLNGTLAIREGGGTPTFYTTFQGADQLGNITYILPASNTNGLLRNTAGVLSWDTNSYLTANQTITLTGDVTGSGTTSIDTIVGDDSHAHTSTTLPASISYLGSQIDISSETNLSGDTEIVLTGDSLSIAASIARDSELHTIATMSGTPDYITLVGQDIVRGLIDLTSDIIGTLPIANGGTGATSLNDLITLGTHTAGNYINTITGNTQIVVGGVGAENATATLSIGADSIGDTQLEFNTGQNLTTTSSPTFAGLTVSGNQTVTGTLGIRESTGATFYTYFQGADQIGNVTYTLPSGAPVADNYVLTSAMDGTLAWQSSGAVGAVNGNGAANQVAYWTGVGTIAGENQLNVSRGGTGVNASAIADGQLLIGNDTANNYTLATLTPGDGINITNGAGSITVASTLGTSIDISSETNLAGDSEIVLDSDSLYIAASIARDSELHDSMTLSGESYLSRVGQALTANQINLASHVTGTLPIANGGTGAVTLDNLITLGTHTTGSYVNTITGNTQIVVGGVGAENATATLAIGADSIGDTQLEFNTGQNLTTTSSPTFVGLTLNGNQAITGTLGIRESDGATFYTYFQGADQIGNVTYTLPSGAPVADNYVLTSATDGTMSWSLVSGVGGMSSFSLAADTGTTQTIGNTETVSILGGTNIASTIDASNNVTLNLDSTLTGVTWNGTDIDISDYTNLAGDTEIVLTGDSLSIAASIARDSELHSEVTLGGESYLSRVGQALTANQINLASHVTGTLPIANGGTGATTLNDLITLGTHTAGNYVQSITNGDGILGGNGGSEGSALTLSIDALTTGTTLTTFSNSGLETTADGVRLIGGCNDGQILTWDADDVRWECTTNTAGSSDWTDDGTATYLTDVTNDFIIGGTSLASSMFGVDESAGAFYFGSDASANPSFNFTATDSDTGTFGFNDNDAFYFSGANVGIGIAAPTEALHISGGNILLDNTYSLKWSAGPQITGGPSMTIDGGTNVLNFRGNSTNHTFISVGGNWGLGDATPESRMEISANGGATDLFMLSSNDDLNGDLFVVKNSGYVGIGDTTPASLFTVGDGDLFQINSSGQVVAGTWNGTDIDISDYTNLAVDGSGEIVLTGDTLSIAASIARDAELHDAMTLSGESYLSRVGQALTAAQINLASHVTGTLPVGNGGTGLSAYGTSNQIMGMNAAGNALEYKTVSGTANQITVTNAVNSLTLSLPQDIATTSSPTFAGVTLSGLTPGSIPFIGTGGIVSQDNLNLSWNDASNYLYLGSAFSFGIDATDSNKFKIYSGNGIAGTSEFSIDENGVTSIANLELGELAFNDDSGAISWIDMGVTSGAVDNTIESYTAQLDGNPMLTIYGLSDGLGGVDNLGVGIGTVTPTAKLHIAAGMATAGGAPLKLTSGTNLTTPEAGAFEYDGTNLYFTPNTTREEVAFMSDITASAVTLTNSPATYDYLTISDQAITLNQINLTTDVTGTLPVGNGGTGLTSYGAANQIMGMNAAGDALEYKTVSGTANQVTITPAANSLTLSLPQDIHTAANPTFAGLTLSGLTAGSIPFIGTGGIVSEDNDNLFYDVTNHYLGLGTTTPTYMLDIAGASGLSNLFRISSAGSDIMTVTDTQTTFSNPVAFGSVGDVSMAYDLVMSNSSSANINFNGSGYIQTTSAWQNLDLTLSAANDGYIVAADTLLNDVDLSAVTAGEYYGTNIDVDSTGIFTTGTTNIYGINSNATASGISTGGTVNTYGGYFSATGENTGAATTNAYGLYVNGATGADNNYSAAFMNGNVGIGTATPTYNLEIADDSSELYSFYANKSNGNTDSSVIRASGTSNTTGVRSSAVGGWALRGDHAGTASGGALQLYSGSITSSVLAYFTQASSVFSGDALVMNMGRGGGSFTGNFINLQVNDSSLFTINASGQVVAGTWMGATIGVGYGGTGTSTAFTTGSIPFAGAGGVYTQDNSNFFWDNSTKRLGIGTNTPGSMLDLFGVNNQLRFSYDISNYATLSADNTGALVMSGSGASGSKITIGSGLAEDSLAIFDGNAQDFHLGLDDTDDIFKIGLGGALGTTDFLSMDANGRIGIGTVAQTALLHLNGTEGVVGLEINSNQTTSTNNIMMLRSDVASADDAVFRVQANGAVYADGAYTGTGADYAEYFFTKNKDLVAGETVCIDEENNNAIKRCSRSGDTNIMGIVSSNPSVIGNGQDDRENDENYKVIGMLGQIPARVNDENGAIKIGDGLAAANMPGYLRKAEAGESTVGIALEKLVSGDSTIQVMISRRNKSLTVETVEQSIQDRIANMEIEDQVNQIIANGAEMLEVRSSLASLELAVTGNGLLVTDIQIQMNQIKEQIREIDFVEMNDKLDTLLSFLDASDGNVKIDGKLEVAITETGALVIKNIDLEAPTIGTGKICGLIADTKDENGNYDNIDDCSGNKIPYDKDGDQMNDWTNNTEPMPKDENHDWIDDDTHEPIINNGKKVIVPTKAVSKNSKIFVTSTSAAIIQPLAVVDIKEGESFTIETNDGIEVDNALEFNWWIVEEGKE